MTAAMPTPDPAQGHGPATAEATTVHQVDAQVFARVFAAEAPRVWRLLRRLGVRDADLEDVCQEVFLVVYRRWGEFRGESALGTWICGIALRKAIAHRRRKSVRDTMAITEAQEPTVAPEQQRELEQKDTRQVLQTALGKLDDAQREVLVLYELEQLPMREVATMLALPLHTAYSRLYAARSELSTELKRLTLRGSMP